ncbi:hypothetical protein [Sphingomonas sp.]|uniref:hypothetical protein n=1 Tax=Sphingomonas sp. TaxID=28214 RepID=UPI00286DF40C|nr:hypothetical protein [Sphingomonas sp.]
MHIKLALAAAAALALALPTGAAAQSAGSGIVSIYHAAPGHQVALLKWLAEQERIAREAGQPTAQIYVHTDGAAWDYLMIAPVTTPEQDAAFEAAAKKLGLTYGPRAGIELRKHISSHTDTFVRGPMTASQILANLGEK